MAKRFTDTNLWDKEWFMSLSLKEKCLVKMVRDKADISGIWSPNWLIASAYIGEKVTESDLLKIGNGGQFKKLKNGKIYCIGFIEFQYGELSEKSPVHKKIINILEQNDLLYDYKKSASNRLCHTLLNRVQEEEEEEEEVMEKVKVVEAKTDFEIALDSFYHMRIKIKKPATERAKELILKKLERLAPNNETMQIEILEQSIVNSWQDIYELKNQNTQNGNTKTQSRTNDTIGGIKIASLAEFSGVSADELSRLASNGGQ